MKIEIDLSMLERLPTYGLVIISVVVWYLFAGLVYRRIGYNPLDGEGGKAFSLLVSPFTFPISALVFVFSFGAIKTWK